MSFPEGAYETLLGYLETVLALAEANEDSKQLPWLRKKLMHLVGGLRESQLKAEERGNFYFSQFSQSRPMSMEANHAFALQEVYLAAKDASERGLITDKLRQAVDGMAARSKPEPGDA